MVESFLIALTTLLIALFIQARAAAREVKRDRELKNVFRETVAASSDTERFVPPVSHGTAHAQKGLSKAV